MLPLAALRKLRRGNTPPIYNGWEQITKRARTRGFMPEFGPMVGYAVTVTIQPSLPAPDPEACVKYRHYLLIFPQMMTD